MRSSPREAFCGGRCHAATVWTSTIISEFMNSNVTPISGAGMADSSPPFRFYDNRQKYLAFVTSCNEKSAIARRAAHELSLLRPTPPAVRIFDAGMGDGTVITRVMRATHRLFPTVPVFAVAKEISLEDVRLGLDKLPDRLFEHPATVFVVTNLNYAEAPRLMPRDAQAAAALNWQEVRLTGTTAHEYAEQIEELGSILDSGWQTTPNPKSGNPKVVRPTVLVIYREDHKFLLDSVIPKPGRLFEHYDLVLASQPWRARMGAEFKVQKVLMPLARSLAPGGRLLAIQSCGKDPALRSSSSCGRRSVPSRSTVTSCSVPCVGSSDARRA